jgi:acyl-coenzyme A synthetase/AMP-(fatty) acid ligase
MQQTNCTKILHASEVLPVVKALVASSSDIDCAEIPSFQEMMQSQSPVYRFDKNFDDARNEPIVILHSSGSTGMYQYQYLTSYE